MARSKAFNESEVLEKAVNLFWSKGYNGASAQDLVDHLGISRSSLYDTFSDKRTLFLKSLKQYQSQQTNALVKLAAQSNDAKQTFQQIFEALSDNSLKDNLVKGCFMVNTAIDMAPHDKEIEQLVQANNKQVEDAFTDLIKKGQEAGQFSNHTAARSLARFMFTTMSGIQVAVRSGAQKKILDNIVKVALEVLG